MIALLRPWVALRATLFAVAVTLAGLIGITIAVFGQAALLVVIFIAASTALWFVPVEFVLWILVAIVAIFPGTAYGQSVGASADTLFSRGSGQLPLPIFEIVVIISAAVVIIRRPIGLAAIRSPVLTLCALTGVYLIAVIGALASGNSLAQALTGTGGRLVIVASATAILTLAAMDDTQAPARLLTVFQVLGVGVATFGIGRYILAGGDPSNPYNEYSGINVHLSFYENAFAWIMTAAFWVALIRWLPGVSVADVDRRRLVRIADIVTIVVTIIALMLTFRRTNYLAIVVGALALLVALRRPRFAIVAALVAVVASFNLLEQARDLSGFGSALSAYGGEDSRKNELLLAWHSVLDHPFGQGVMGSYSGYPGSGWIAPPTIVHDTFLWIGLKVGWLGAVLLLVVLGAGAYGALRASTQAADARIKHVSLVVLALLGAWLVMFAFATPLLEARLATLFGIWLGVISACISRTPQRRSPRDRDA